MVKRTTKKAAGDAQKQVTIVFGYGLFALTIITVIISVIIPFSSLLGHDTVNKANVISIMISLAAGALLPAFASYFLGDRATHVKNKVSHHYNGVLFGIAAFWLSMFLSQYSAQLSQYASTLTPYFLRDVINAWPILVTVLVMTFVAVTFAHHPKKKASVLEHLPYQIILAGSVAVYVLLGMLGMPFDTPAIAFMSLISIGLSVVFAGVSYGLLKHTQPTKLIAFMGSLVAASIAYITFLTVNWIAPYQILPEFIRVAATLGTTLIVWGAYVWLTRRYHAAR